MHGAGSRPLGTKAALAPRAYLFGAHGPVSSPPVPSEKRARQRANRQAKTTAAARHTKRRRLLIRSGVVIVVALAVFGIAYAVEGGGSSSPSSGSKSTTTRTAATSSAQQAANRTAEAAGCPANPYTRVNTLTWPKAPPMTIDPSKTYRASIRTDVGTFAVALDASTAPVTVNNFVFLADHHFYRCVIFQRVIPGFMDQTGDPTGTGSGGPGYTIADEYPKKAANPADQYPLGSVAMANTGQPHSGGSQFFIVAGPQGEDLAPSYSLFGQVTSGMSVVQRINADGNASASANGVPPKVVHRILSVTISHS